MPNTTAHYLFLPWLRQGLTTSANVTDTLGANQPARLTMQLQLQVNNTNAGQMPVRFYGPGDVLGIDPREVVRTEPSRGLPNFEPNLFPFIEFDRPDFPWLFTPATANSDGRLRPWLCLVVLSRQEGVRLTVDPRRPLPVLECPLAELPDLADSWAWGHTQITSTGSGAGHPTLNDLLRDYPERTISRLLCPRRLEPGVAYLACLVPAFAVGCKAGLGELVTAADEAALQPAWPSPSTAPTASVRLPVYYHWEFMAGPAGDFEALARRLQVRVLPAEVGLQHVAIHAPGWGMPSHPVEDPGSVLELEGVLRNPTSAVAPWPQAAANDFRGRLLTILNSPADSGGGPVVKPPIYGQEYARTAGVPENNDPPHWLRELNLDPRYRLAAGLGAMVVRYEQERLMASAWTQLAAAERSVQAQRRAAFGEAVNSALAAKHLPALTTAAGAASAASSAAPAEQLMRARSMSSSVAVRSQAVSALISHANGSLARRLIVQGQLPAESQAEVASQAMKSQMRMAAASAETPASSSEPFRFSPSFPQPMVERLRDYFAHMLLPGLSQVPPNTIALLETNPAFVEAYMVGLNHEMGRELLWREFPANRRGTYFQNFWSDPRPAGGAPQPALDDLPPIADWTAQSHLGDHLQQGGGGGGNDPALEGQITAAQAQVNSFMQQIAALAADIATLSGQRDGAEAAGEPVRLLLRFLRGQRALIGIRQYERAVAQQAALEWDEEALADDQAAVDVYTSVEPQRVELAALQVIADQISPLEASLQPILAQIAGFTQQIAALVTLGNQLTAERTTTQAAGDAGRTRLANIQAQVATIPQLQTQVTAADQEAAGYQAQAQTAQAQAAAIRATVAPARQRLAELEALARLALEYKDKLPELESEIRELEEDIAEHRAHQPPAPPDGKGGKGMAGPPMPGDPYAAYYEWLKRLQEMEAELARLQEEYARMQQAIVDIQEQLLEVPALQAQVNAAEQEAAPFDAAANAALASAAGATDRATALRNQITAIQQQAAQIPAIQAEIQTADARVVSLSQQIEALPAQIAPLETARTAAQAQANPIQAEIGAIQAQIVEMPNLQAQIAAAEAQAADYQAQAQADRQAAAEARATVVTLTAAITQLEGVTAQIPTIEAQLQAIEANLLALAGQIEAKQSQLVGREALREAAQAQLWQLLTERTMRHSQLVLLIRGDLLRRFSRASIYAVEAEWANAGRTQRRLGSNESYPIFRETWGSDLTFLGFSLTGQAARGGGAHPGWYFVIQEQLTEPRFGLDAPSGAGRPVGDITTWDSLSWDDLVADPADLPDLVYIPLAGRLNGQQRPAYPAGSGGVPPVAQWGQTSAHMALITQQKPLRMAIHASVWLPQPL